MTQPLIYADPTSQAHDGGADHPERPERLRACLDACASAGFAVEESLPAATDEQLARVHDPMYVARLQRFCERGGGRMDPDTYVTEASFAIARRASGAACAAVDRALNDEGATFCLVRPPGHHATQARGMGFCLLNHVAVGAAHAIASGARRVAIVDFDVHHGNGTQDIFWDRSDVAYLSLHQFPWYPGTGLLEEIGGGAGAGATLNIPLPAGTPDAVYLAAFRRIVLPALDRWKPDLIAVSAGYDAHHRDPLASMRMTSAGFGTMTSLLMAAADRLCAGRILMTLEGGYDLKALGSSLVATLQAMGDPTGHAGHAGEDDGPLDGPPESVAALERAEAFHRAPAAT
ncbi:MAG TPA: histone deacetylase [Actinomycetota bacterium]|nr:histone deacetylase [Actinomycetota bacterium]